jgi:hypothetical protein
MSLGAGGDPLQSPADDRDAIVSPRVVPLDLDIGPSDIRVLPE